MKKKKIVITIVSIIAIFAVVMIAVFNSGSKSTNSLLNKLAKSVNDADGNKIENCYPEFIRGTLPILSNAAIKTFHDRVGNISFDVVNQNVCDSSDILKKQNEINKEYGCDIKLEEYNIIVCKYHKDFSETSFEMIKIDGKWYLYYGEYLPEPLSYFVK